MQQVAIEQSGDRLKNPFGVADRLFYHDVRALHDLLRNREFGFDTGDDPITFLIRKCEDAARNLEAQGLIIDPPWFKRWAGRATIVMCLRPNRHQHPNNNGGQGCY